MKKIIIVLIGMFCFFTVVSCENTGNDVETVNFTDKSAHEHTYVSEIIEPSCTDNGYTLYSCSLCDDNYLENIISATGHIYKESRKDAPCNQWQTNVYTCSACQHCYSENVDIKGTIHSYFATVTYPSRENGGYTTHTCNSCADSYVDSYTEPVDFSVGLNYTQKNGGYYVYGIGACTDTELVIPSVSEQGFKVVGILENAFSNSDVRSIIVSDGVTDIQSGAFSGCRSLETVVLPKNSKPAENIFSNNPRLAKLTMPMSESLAYYFKWSMTTPEGYKELIHSGNSTSKIYGTVPCSLREINILGAPVKSALSGCDMLTKVTIASDAKYIGAYAFKNCTGLTEFQIPETVISIGSYAFANTSIRSITIPENVSFTTSDQYIFADCLMLSKVTFLSQSSVMPPYMFLNCVSLDELEIPRSITYLGGSFIAGTAIERFNVPSGVTEISTHTFNGCTKLKEINLPNDIRTIQYGAFANCTSLEELILPESLETIEFEAFKNCTSLKTVIFPSNLKNIDYSAFENCVALKNVELYEGIEKIEYKVFMGCTSLEKVILPSSLKIIGFSAFEGCTSLVCVELPANIEKILKRTFFGCSSLKEITLPDTVNSIGYSAFEESGIVSMVLPSGITRIEKNVFANCMSLMSIEFNEGVTLIDENAFFGCTAIESIILPATLKGIGANAFKNCTSLKTVDFSNANMSEENVKYGINWFSGCISLTEVKNFDKIDQANTSIFYNTPLQNNTTNIVD